MTRPAGFSLALAAAWPAVPLGMLAICGLRIPLYARAPLPIERYALHIQFVTQILLTCFFAPAAARNHSNLLIGLLQSSFLLVVATLLAEESATKCLTWIGYESIWWMGLAGWSRSGNVKLTPALISTISFTTACTLAMAFYFEAERNEPIANVVNAANAVAFVVGFGCMFHRAK